MHGVALCISSFAGQVRHRIHRDMNKWISGKWKGTYPCQTLKNVCEDWSLPLGAKLVLEEHAVYINFTEQCRFCVSPRFLLFPLNWFLRRMDLEVGREWGCWKSQAGTIKVDSWVTEEFDILLTPRMGSWTEYPYPLIMYVQIIHVHQQPGREVWFSPTQRREVGTTFSWDDRWRSSLAEFSPWLQFRSVLLGMLMAPTVWVILERSLQAVWRLKAQNRQGL